MGLEFESSSPYKNHVLSTTLYSASLEDAALNSKAEQITVTENLMQRICPGYIVRPGVVTLTLNIFSSTSIKCTNFLNVF